MSYIRTSNFPAGSSRSNVDNQNKIHRWFVEHSFSNEITTTPQSIHNLIVAQSDNMILAGEGLYPQRAMVEISNPGNVSGNPTIYVKRSPLTDWPKPFTATASEFAMWTLPIGAGVEILGGGNMDFLIWCSTGTASLLFVERG